MGKHKEELFPRTLKELQDERERLILETQYRPANSQRQHKNWKRIREINEILKNMQGGGV